MKSNATGRYDRVVPVWFNERAKFFYFFAVLILTDVKAAR